MNSRSRGGEVRKERKRKTKFCLLPFFFLSLSFLNVFSQFVIVSQEMRWYTCIVSTCTNTLNNSHGKNITFHKIPDSSTTQAKLVNHLKLKKLLPEGFIGFNNNSRICSVHYLPEDYQHAQRKILKRNALPTVFPCEDEPAGKRRRITGKSLCIFLPAPHK